MNNLYIMIGCPGSGKSTWADKMISDNPDTEWISRDMIRFLLVDENEPYFLKEKEVFKEFIKEINNGLSLGRNVIADATHINPNSRTKLFKALNIDKTKTRVIAVVMRTPLKECIRRNELRKGTRSYVPEDVVRRMYSNLQTPSFDEYKNIFDEIDEIYPDQMVKLYTKPYEDNKGNKVIAELFIQEEEKE